MLKFVLLFLFAAACVIYRFTAWEPMSKEERDYKNVVEKLLQSRLPLTKALPEAEAYMRRMYGGKHNWPYPAEELLYRKKLGWLQSRDDPESWAYPERDAMEAVKKTNWRQS